MALRSSPLSTRFFVALIVLLVALLGITSVAFDGLDRVQGANDQVYSDNYLTAETTSQPSTDREGAMQVAEATRLAIASIREPNSDQAVTASVGVAILPDDAGDSVALFRAADRALYAAKRNGRNRVEAATSAIGLRESHALGETSDTAA